ncbi:hypothetical protein Scep_018360 [Stephania cephalantha]|uniref:Uncharacterized protein n=1 Tax=Stephania cephalantha TaxID=152367 RepID=A0AAP0IRA5_9MAGN
MDTYQRSFTGLEKISLNNAVGCEPDIKRREREVVQPPASPMGVICPAPRRVARSPLMVENLNRLCCRPKSDLPASGDPSAEILSIILTKNDPENDLDAGHRQRGFFFGSPPMRANNPLIHDRQFVQETSSVASPLGPSHGGKAASTWADRQTPCSASSAFGSKPMVRIEGFACRSSKSQCVVPALA